MCKLTIDIQAHGQPEIAGTYLAAPIVHIWARSKYVSPAVLVVKMVSTSLRICRMFSAKQVRAWVSAKPKICHHRFSADKASRDTITTDRLGGCAQHASFWSAVQRQRQAESLITSAARGAAGKCEWGDSSCRQALRQELTRHACVLSTTIGPESRLLHSVQHLQHCSRAPEAVPSLNNTRPEAASSQATQLLAPCT